MRLLNFFIFFLIVIFDQLTKKYLLFDIGLNNSKPFIPGLVQFTVVQNTGGAFRIVHGGVIDFFDLQLFNFAVFNLADVFIDIGVVLIVIGWFISKKKY